MMPCTANCISETDFNFRKVEFLFRIGNNVFIVRNYCSREGNELLIAESIQVELQTWQGRGSSIVSMAEILAICSPSCSD